jgi:hypothetical protein
MPSADGDIDAIESMEWQIRDGGQQVFLAMQHMIYKIVRNS